MYDEAEAKVKLTACSAIELGRMIACREVTALEAVEAHVEKIEDVNDELNAVVVERFEAARAEAREADRRHEQGRPLGPLDGVPITVKESLKMAGTPATAGIESRRGVVADADDPYVARLRAAGAVVLGKTNVAQLLIYYESDNPVYGRTNNPWEPGRTAGGSSGGEGAIIAAGDRHRHRRQPAHPGRLLRHRQPQTHQRPHRGRRPPQPAHRPAGRGEPGGPAGPLRRRRYRGIGHY